MSTINDRIDIVLRHVIGTFLKPFTAVKEVPIYTKALDNAVVFI